MQLCDGTSASDLLVVLLDHPKQPEAIGQGPGFVRTLLKPHLADCADIGQYAAGEGARRPVAWIHAARMAAAAPMRAASMVA